MELVPERTMKLDKERVIRLDYGVLKKFKDLTEKDFSKCVALGFSTEESIELMWAAFSEDDKNLQREDFEKMWHAGLMIDFMGKVFELINESFPEPQEGGEKNPVSPIG